MICFSFLFFRVTSGYLDFIKKSKNMNRVKKNTNERQNVFIKIIIRFENCKTLKDRSLKKKKSVNSEDKLICILFPT